MRKNIVAGNWKMNNTLTETKSLLESLLNKKINSNVEVIVAPSFVNLSCAIDLLKDSDIIVAAQNVHHLNNGAFTGEVSAPMLKSLGVTHVIIGHSERRAYFAENNELLKDKLANAIDNDLTVIYCFGEELSDRKSGSYLDLIERQIKEVLFTVDSSKWSKIVLAYEPVWAIGTGETASPDQAQEIHAFVRQMIASEYGSTVANNVSILYGGSVKADNAKEIFSKPDVDGGLIGGASLKADDFVEIINAF